MSKGNKTNTGHRFVSKAENHFKIHIHAPNDTVIAHSVGFLKIGESRGLKKAIALRNKVGTDLWGEHWKKVVSDETVFNRMPRNLEPMLVVDELKCGSVMKSYRAMWSDGAGKRYCRKRSLNKHGRAEAYKQTKKLLLNAYADVIDIMLFMGRITEKDLDLGYKNNG